MQVLVLASSSQYRAALLQRLNRPFRTLSPNIDESARPGEAPAALASRLALEKALAVAKMLKPDDEALIIASDQVASFNNRRIGKPGTVPVACEQLLGMSGQQVTFHTAVCVLPNKYVSTGLSPKRANEQAPTGNPDQTQPFTALDTTVAHLRSLDPGEIERYVKADNPLDCAGSFKVEALGISLFKSVDSRDPTALIGLPMITLCDGLRQFGLTIP